MKPAFVVELQHYVSDLRDWAVYGMRSGALMLCHCSILFGKHFSQYICGCILVNCTITASLYFLSNY